jgi:hypothetical protein
MINELQEDLSFFNKRHEELSKKLNSRSKEEIEYDEKSQEEFLADIAKEKDELIKNGDYDMLPDIEAREFETLTEQFPLGLFILEEEIEKIEHKISKVSK